MTRRRKTDPRGRSMSAGRFVLLPHWLLRSAAWMTLSPDAKALLLHVWQRHNGANNGEISYAVREAAAIGLSKDRTARAFAALIERGFLVCTRASAFTVKTRDARLWRITAEPCGNELRGTKDFMFWTPNSRAHATVKPRTQSHPCDAQSRP